RRLIAVDEAAEKANGREVCAWAAMDVDTGELPAIEATWSRSSLDALLSLGRVLGACTNKPAFAVDGARGTHGPSGGSGLSAAAGRSGTGAGLRGPSASLDRMMNIFFVYYNGLRFHKGIGRVPSEVIAVRPAAQTL
ncbi:MAG: hypothetical protein RXR82_07305, partial [Nitrososphaeria archaeon]